MIDYAQTLQEMRSHVAWKLGRTFGARWSVRQSRHATSHRGICREYIKRIRAIDTALCALRIVKPELSRCFECGKRCMLDYDFCDTEVCVVCVGSQASITPAEDTAGSVCSEREEHRK